MILSNNILTLNIEFGKDSKTFLVNIPNGSKITWIIEKRENRYFLIKDLIKTDMELLLEDWIELIQRFERTMKLEKLLS